MSEAKILCRVQGCQRGTHASTAMRRWGTTRVSLICAAHWRRLTKAERRCWARLRRQERRFGREAVGARSERIWSALTRRAGAPA